MSSWPSQRYEDCTATCDTLHAHTQVLGKLAAVLAPPEPQLQHAALVLTAPGWGAPPRAAGAAMAARGARPDGSRLGDAAAAGALRRAGRRPGPARARGVRRVQRRP